MSDRQKLPASILTVEASTHRRHALHDDARQWPQTNCYVDLWVETLHALHLDPVAALAFTLAIDFEGDQWTFFKFPLADLRLLYGIDVQELSVWRPLVEHVEVQVARGRLVIVEVDAWWLPDTAGTSYRARHEKTSIAVLAIDRPARALGYFHNSGYHALTGDDFDGLFARADGALAPYVEFVKLDALVRRGERESAATAVALARAHLAGRPASNPFVAYRDRIAGDVTWLGGQGIESFHAYAFATLRQCGSAHELAATFVRWLSQHAAEVDRAALSDCAADFDAIAASTKAMQFALARTARGKRVADFTGLLDEMAGHWNAGMGRLDAALGG